MSDKLHFISAADFHASLEEWMTVGIPRDFDFGWYKNQFDPFNDGMAFDRMADILYHDEPSTQSA